MVAAAAVFRMWLWTHCIEKALQPSSLMTCNVITRRIESSVMNDLGKQVHGPVAAVTVQPTRAGSTEH